MGLFDKLKNVLFETEEIEIPIRDKKEKKKELTSEPKELKLDPEVFNDDLVEEKVDSLDEAEVKHEKPITKPIKKIEEFDELEFSGTKSGFEFPVFDESDFTPTKKPKLTDTNVFDVEPRKSSARNIDFGKYNTEEEKPKEEIKTFRPSPVISPVYGVMDQEKPKEPRENIIPKEDKVKPPRKANKVDLDEIRNKAYGTLEDEITDLITSPEENFEEKNDTDEIPTKSIDDLLYNTVDEKIEIDDEEDTGELDIKDFSKTMNVLEEIDEELKSREKKAPTKEQLENETLETDLFNLIDAMYDTREDDE